MTDFAFGFFQNPQTGWRVVRLSCPGPDPRKGGTVAQFVPELGSNLFSFQVDGIEYLSGLAEFQGRQRLLGTPILYPTPNRVRDSQFTFAGRTFRFEPNDGPNFLHGLVRETPWACDEGIVTEESVSVSTRIRFEPGTEIHRWFPIRNTLELTYTLKPGVIRFDFSIRNDDEKHLLPFGLAIHPWFRVIGERGGVRLQVPAQKWMEAVDLLPTGELIDLEYGPADLRQPTPLEGLHLDDVFWGLVPDKPQVIYYDSIRKRVTLRASDLFTHSVVYTQQTAHFCVENQTCSTDAHNLHARGLRKEAHLTILRPGESLTAWIEIAVSDQ